MALIPSTRYPAQTDTDPAYPQGKARNAVTFQDGTGTPLEKDWINDLWGFLQSLLDAAAIVPSGSPDQVGASQYLDAVNFIAASEADAAELAAIAYADDAADRAALLRLREVSSGVPFNDSAGSMAVIGGITAAQAILIKASTNDTHYIAQDDDSGTTGGTPGAHLSTVNGVARNGARLVAVGIGLLRCAISTNEGASWFAGSDLGASADTGGIVYNPTHSVFVVTFASGINVARDVDGASVWGNVATSLTTGQGGIAMFSNGDLLVGGLDGASAVAMSRSVNGGAAWSATATVPNPADYGDSGTIVGNGGARIFHAGRANANTEIRICSTTSAMAWSLLATIVSPSAITSKPRILMCQDTGALVVVWDVSGATLASSSRDLGVTWSAPRFFRTRAAASFGMARGRLFSTFSAGAGADTFASDKLI